MGYLPKLLVVALLQGPLASVVLAQSAPPAEIADQIEVCNSCHGADGRPVNPESPIIWGQEQYYIYVQLRDFQAGRRANEMMGPLVADLPRETLRALAEYYAKQPWPNTSYKAEEGDKAATDQMATAGQCTQCHLGTYVGNSRIPRMASQTPVYLEKTMLDFKNKRRMNAADMVSLMEGFSDEDIAAAARYFSSLQPH